VFVRSFIHFFCCFYASSDSFLRLHCMMMIKKKRERILHIYLCSMYWLANISRAKNGFGWMINQFSLEST